MAVNRTSKAKGKVLDIPDATVTIGTASDDGTGTGANVAFTVTTSALGGPVFNYKVVSNPGSVTATGTTSPINITGLTTDTAYTFTVAANNPTGAGVYSSASNSVTPTNPYYFDSIATVTATGATSTITFSSIPQTYKHLQIRGIGKLTSAGTFSYIGFNSDTTGANYYSHRIYGSGGTYGSEAGAGVSAGSRFTTFYDVGWTGFVFDLLDYSDTNKYKTGRILSGFIGTSNDGEANFISQLWQSKSAVTSITITIDGNTVVAGSKFALYGVRG